MIQHIVISLLIYSIVAIAKFDAFRILFIIDNFNPLVNLNKIRITHANDISININAIRK